MYFLAPPLLPSENAHDSIAWRTASTLLCHCSAGQIYIFVPCKAAFKKWLSRRRRCNRNKICLNWSKIGIRPLKTSIVHAVCRSGVRCKLQTLQTRGQATNDRKIVLKWSLDRSFPAHNKVKIFRNGFLSAYFNLMWFRQVKVLNFMSDSQLQSWPRKVKYLHF